MTAMAPPAVEFGAQRIVVEGLVGEQGADDDAADQRFDADAVVSLTRQQDEARQIAERIDKRDDFGRQTTARSPDCLILSPPLKRTSRRRSAASMRFSWRAASGKAASR